VTHINLGFVLLQIMGDCHLNLNLNSIQSNLCSTFLIKWNLLFTKLIRFFIQLIVNGRSVDSKVELNSNVLNKILIQFNSTIELQFN
jgi:hypothetical protein